MSVGRCRISEATPSDLDIYRSAAILIEHHGDRAGIVPAMRQDAMLAKDDLAGVMVWQAIGRTDPGSNVIPFGRNAAWRNVGYARVANRIRGPDQMVRGNDWRSRRPPGGDSVSPDAIR